MQCFAASASAGSRPPRLIARAATRSARPQEDAEAELISSYLPAELSDEELAAIADEAVAESGAAGMQDMGKVMGVAMGKVGGRADGKRVSAAIRERLAGG